MAILGGYGEVLRSSPRTTAAVAYIAAPGNVAAGCAIQDRATEDSSIQDRAIQDRAIQGGATEGGVTAGGATAGLAIVKGETPAADWALVTLSAGGTRKVALQVVNDLPHLVVESVFGIDDGRWGTLAADGLPDVARPGHVVATAAVEAVVNRWRRGPDSPQGVRDRLRARARRETWLAARIAGLAEALDDAEIRAARDGVQAAFRQWARLPVGGALRLAWPLLY